MLAAVVLLSARGLFVGVTLAVDGLRIHRMIRAGFIPLEEIRTLPYEQYSFYEVSRHGQVLICRTHAHNPQGGTGEVEIGQAMQRERNIGKTANRLNAVLPNTTAQLRELPRRPGSGYISGRHRTRVSESN